MINVVADSALPDQVTIERLVATAIFSDSGWWGGPFGSRLHEIERESVSEATAGTVRAMIASALQPLVASGVIVVDNIITATDGPRIDVEIIVRAAGEQITFDFRDLWGLYGA